MRVAIGGLMQETNSFSPVATTLADFEAEYLLRDAEIPEYFAGTNTEIAGFLAACESLADVHATPLLAAAANSGVSNLARHGSSTLRNDPHFHLTSFRLQRPENARATRVPESQTGASTPLDFGWN